MHSFFNILCLVASLHANAVDYCSIKSCENSTEHVMCLYKQDTLGENCQDYQKNVELTMNDKKKIIKIHNFIRNKVAISTNKMPPPIRYSGMVGAGNMNELSWDTELETLAKRWAMQCRTTNKTSDKCRNTVNYPNVGQIIYVVGESSGMNVEEIFGLTYLKKKNFQCFLSDDDNSSSLTLSSNQREYNQLIWADTSTIGCAWAAFVSKSFNKSEEVLVCNYSERSKMDVEPYREGAPCVYCYCSYNYEGLCAGTGDLQVSFVFLAAELVVLIFSQYLNHGS